MKITLRLFLTYQRLLPVKSTSSECEIEIPDGSKPRDILIQYGVPVDDNTVFLVNGRTLQDPNDVLKEGDVLSAFPVAAGG